MTDMTIVQCTHCGSRNRIRPHSNHMSPVCGRCGSPLVGYCLKQSGISRRLSTGMIKLIGILLFLLIPIVCYGIVITPRWLSKDFSDLPAAEAESTSRFRAEQEETLAKLEAKLQQELAQIDSMELNGIASAQYHNSMNARLSYDKKYALTPREKAQLSMLNLAKDSTRSYHEAIKAVATEAAPNGSNIRVTESLGQIGLHIDFDMSSMTSGEHGTSTKHDTIDSLRKEVVVLISKVTNDVFLFCKDLELETIHVACKHHVQTTRPDGTTSVENTLLYKILVHRNRMPKLSNNPFLDLYSTTEYLQVEEDNFEELEIIRTRI